MKSRPRRWALAFMAAAAVASAGAAADRAAEAVVQARLREAVGPVAAGDIDLRVLPLRLRIADLRVFDSREPAEPAIAVRQLVLDFNWVSVLKGRPSLDYVLCDIERIDLKRYADGGWNIERGPLEEPRAPGGEGEYARPSEAPGGEPPVTAAQGPAIGELELKVGIVSLADYRYGEARVQNLPLHLHERYFGLPGLSAAIRQLMARPVFGRPLAELLAGEGSIL